MEKKITQRDRVLQFIKERGSITAYEAVIELGCTQLAARICELENKGYLFETECIKTKNRYGDRTHYYKYRLVGEYAV